MIKKSKLIAPLTITAVLIIYLLLNIGFIVTIQMNMIIKLLLGIIPATGIGMSVYVLAKIIKEIRSVL